MKTSKKQKIGLKKYRGTTQWKRNQGSDIMDYSGDTSSAQTKSRSIDTHKHSIDYRWSMRWIKYMEKQESQPHGKEGKHAFYKLTVYALHIVYNYSNHLNIKWECSYSISWAATHYIAICLHIRYRMKINTEFNLESWLRLVKFMEFNINEFWFHVFDSYHWEIPKNIIMSGIYV